MTHVIVVLLLIASTSGECIHLPLSFYQENQGDANFQASPQNDITS